MKIRHIASMSILVACALAACGSDDDDGHQGGPTGSPDQVASSCESPADCYPGVDHATLAGEVLCLDRVRDGHCTHECATDDDCCAAEGECETGFDQVCAPFENTNTRMCFLSCEGRNDEYCQREVSSDFICRASGGGDPRKVCVPGDCGVGASCASDVDCASGLACNRDFAGGYCGAGDCDADADCEPGSVCVAAPAGGRVCLRTCQGEADCTFCRRELAGSRCTGDVQLVESTGLTVCSPFTG
jgi:hypothetical protein